MSERADLYRLCLETSLGVRTVERVLRGEHTRESTRRVVTLAAKRLHIALPSSLTSSEPAKASAPRARVHRASKSTRNAHARGAQ